jgi:hypothetical protein
MRLVHIRVGDKKQFTIGGSVDFTYPCLTYVEASLWLTVDPDTTGGPKRVETSS